MQNSKGYIEKVLSDTTSCNSLFTIIIGVFDVRFSVWWTRDKITIEVTLLESLTTMHGFHQLILQLLICYHKLDPTLISYSLINQIQ